MLEKANNTAFDKFCMNYDIDIDKIDVNGYHGYL